MEGNYLFIDDERKFWNRNGSSGFLNGRAAILKHRHAIQVKARGGIMDGLWVNISVLASYSNAIDAVIEYTKSYPSETFRYHRIAR